MLALFAVSFFVPGYRCGPAGAGHVRDLALLRPQLHFTGQEPQAGLVQNHDRRHNLIRITTPDTTIVETGQDLARSARQQLGTPRIGDMTACRAA